MGRNRVPVAALVLLVGAVAVGAASVGADRIPYTAREGGLEHHTLPALLYFALLTLVDTYLGWCVIPVLLGYWTTRSAGRAAATGAAFAVVTFAVYTTGAHLRLVAAAREYDSLEGIPEPPTLPEPSVLDTAVGMVLSPLLLMAVVGAFLGALAGYYARRWPLLLLVLAAAAAVDLWRRADTPWLSIANGLPNVLLAATGVAVVAWTVTATVRGRRGAPRETSEQPV